MGIPSESVSHSCFYPSPPTHHQFSGFKQLAFIIKLTNRETNDTNNDTNDTNDANSTKRGCALSDKLLKMIRANGRVTIEEMMRQCRVSRPTITRAISGLKVAGRVRRIGGTRGVWEIIG